MPALRRRDVLAGGAALLAASPLAVTPNRGIAATTRPAGYQRSQLGKLELNAIGDGIWNRPIAADFVRNAALSEVHQAMAEAAMPARNALPLPFTALVVKSKTGLVLIDTGTGGQIAPTANAFNDNLAAAGVDARAIDTVLVSHFHPDHINGIKTKDNERVFPNAEIKVPAAEWSFWMDDANLRAAPQAIKIYFLNARRIFGISRIR